MNEKDEIKELLSMLLKKAATAKIIKEEEEDWENHRDVRELTLKWYNGNMVVKGLVGMNIPTLEVIGALEVAKYNVITRMEDWSND